MLKAVTRGARHVDARIAELNSSREKTLTVANFFDHHATDADLEVSVREEDFEGARRELVPSVSFEELGHYERVRDAFEGATKKAQADEGGGPATSPALVQRPGSRARGGETGRPKLSDVMKRANGSAGAGHAMSYGGRSKDKVPTMNGSGKKNAGAADDSDADEDDFVIRTDKMSINSGGGSRPVSSRGTSGKGKGKGAAVVDGARGGQEEDLYD